FFFKNANGPSMFVSSLRVLGVPSEGSVLRSVSSPASSGLVGQILDLDTTAGAWVTDAGQNSNQSLILMLPGTSPLTIDQVALQPTPTSIDPGASAKDFDILVSATDMADASFTTAFSGTLQNIAVPQQFSFAPVQARFVKLLLKDNFNGANQLALNSFYVVSPQVGGTTARFVDRSTDSNGKIVSYLWDFGDGSTSTARDPIHTYSAPGTYTVKLTVTNDAAQTGSTQLVYTALVPLPADFAYTPQLPAEGTTLVRFFDSSPARIGAAAHRNWSFGDGGSTPSNNPNNVYRDSGTYQATLTVGDPNGIHFTVTKPVTVLN